MSTVAADVLCECFALLPFCDRVTATHVCTHWRQASLSRPGALWSHIVSTGTRTGVVRQLFERAQNVPVKVEILLIDETFEDAMAAVSDHLFHICQLFLPTLELGDGALSMANNHLVYRALACPAPVLEELEIALPVLEQLEIPLPIDCGIPTDMFAGHAPRLRKAAFLTTQLPPDGVPALAGLTRLKYTCWELPAAQLSAIVSTLPKLKALCIVAQCGYELPETPPPAEFQLDELDLEVRQIRSGVSLRPLLRYLKHHHIRDLTTYRFDDAGWLDNLVSPSRSSPRTLHLYGGHRVFCNWELVDADGYASRGRAFKAAALFDALLARSVFSSVETLVLSVDLLGWDIPPLARLTHLSLCCSHSSDISPHVAVPRARTIPCPDLGVLELCGPGPTADKVTVRAGDLERFFENVFSFSQHRLPRFVLRNVSLDVSELLQYQSIFGTLSTAEEPLAVPAALDSKARRDKWDFYIEESLYQRMMLL